MKIYFVNVNGFKSKATSIQGIINEEDPGIIGMVETKMADDEPLEIKEYVIYRNKDGGGTMIAIKIKYKHLISNIKKVNIREESMWMDLDASTKRYRFGVIYMPQEDKTPKKEMMEIYKRITKEVNEAKNEYRITTLMGDFNCKVGDAIDGNIEQVTKGGKMILQMIEEENMKLVNNMKQCERKWTWTRTMKKTGEEKKSILDYMIISEEASSTISKAKIDGSKEIAPSWNDNGKSHIRTTGHSLLK